MDPKLTNGDGLTWRFFANVGGAFVMAYVFHRWLCAEWPFADGAGDDAGDDAGG